MGVWWWGSGPPTPFQRNAWIVRRPQKRDELSNEDHWEVVHEHQGCNPGFEKALELFMHHMPQMARAAECVATAVGAPFLRVDFFVGDPRWGVRLNEVAYGSGTMHKRPSNSGGPFLVDDSTAMAQILREGMVECTNKRAAEKFLAPLGVQGSSYIDAVVGKTSTPESLCLPDGDALQLRCDIDEAPLHPELCVT